MIADENGKFDQEMLAALTRLGFEIEDGGHSAYAECSVLIGDDKDFRIQMATGHLPPRHTRADLVSRKSGRS